MSGWMLNCKEYSKIVSSSMDRPLPLRQKLTVKLHQMLCPPCERLGKHLEVIRKACRQESTGSDCDEAVQNARLPEDVCQRIKAAMKQ